MPIKDKAILAAAVMAASLSPVGAQNQQGDSIKQNKIEMTASKQDAFKAFENMYSNALYMKYRADAGLAGNDATPKEMFEKIEKTSAEYAGNFITLKRSGAVKEELRAMHTKQMSGVTYKDGVYSYSYEKDGKPRRAQGELIGSATSFVQQEKEEREFKDFSKVRNELMQKQR